MPNLVDGSSNFPRGHFMAGRDVLPIDYPPRYHVFFDDFDKYTAGDWVITTTEGGANSATEAVGDIDGGVLVLTNDIADNDLDFLQSVAEIFKLEVGKKAFFETRMKMNEVIQSEFIIGLQVRDTTALAVTDGVFFQSDDGDALIDFHSVANSVATSALGIATAVADTFVTLGWYYDGAGGIEVAVNNTVVTTLRGVVPSTTELTVSFGHQTGEATNVKVMSIDWILAAKER